MKRLLILILLCQILFAQVDWFGYYEHEDDYSVLKNSKIYFGYDKFRLDFQTEPSENVRIGGDVVSRFYHGETSWNVMEFIPSKYYPVNPSIDDFGNVVYDTLGYYPLEMVDTLFLDNMFIQIHHSLGDFAFGRQQISLGTGYAWNPVDIFNQKDVLDPTYEQTGVNAMRLSVPVGAFLTTGIMVQPQKSWEDSWRYYRLKSYIGRFDISIVMANLKYTQSGLITKTISNRDMYGLNIVGEFAGVGLHAEIAANDVSSISEDLLYEYLVGADYTFKSGLFCMAEYYHNDFGVLFKDVDFNEYYSTFLGERKSLNRDYLFLLTMFPVTDLIDMTFSGLVNINDKSFVVNPELFYRIFEDVEISVMGNIFSGKADTEYGYQTAAARFRIRAYF